MLYVSNPHQPPLLLPLSSIFRCNETKRCGLDRPFTPYPIFPPKVASGTTNKPTATVTLYDTELEKEGCVAGIGTGPVDAAYKAIDTLVGANGCKLLEYSVARYALF